MNILMKRWISNIIKLVLLAYLSIQNGLAITPQPSEIESQNSTSQNPLTQEIKTDSNLDDIKKEMENIDQVLSQKNSSTQNIQAPNIELPQPIAVDNVPPINPAAIAPKAPIEAPKNIQAPNIELPQPIAVDNVPTINPPAVAPKENKTEIYNKPRTQSSILSKVKSIQAKEITPDQLEFVENELIMLENPDGDFVTGEISEESKLYRMTFNDYYKIFCNNFQTQANKAQKNQIDRYADEYDSMFKKPINKNQLAKTKNYVKSIAIDNMINDYFEEFRVIIDKYQLIHTKYKDSNNLLHLSSSYDKELFARYLLAKGINQFELNDHNFTPYHIAKTLQKFDIIRLLLNARITKNLYY